METEAAVNETISRLRDAINQHDPEAVARLFAPEYRSEQPLHPQRGFGGREQVAATWSEMFADVPNLEAGVVKETTAGTTSWSEWVWHGAHRDGTPFLMKGVTVMGLREDGLIAWGRVYMEPVDQGGAAIDEAVRQLSGSDG
jgi:ketosteroid isomerase-like protein